MKQYAYDMTVENEDSPCPTYLINQYEIGKENAILKVVFETLEGASVAVEKLNKLRVLEEKRVKRNKKANANRRAMNEAMGSLGLVRVKGDLGGIYWE